MTDETPNAGGTPRWVKVFAIVSLVVVLLLVVLLIAGRGGHGPGRHAGHAGGQASAPGAHIA